MIAPLMWLLMGFWCDLFPMFPRKSGLFPKILGTLLFNGGNGLGVIFGFVPNVPKIFERYPEESLRRVLATRPWFIWLWNV
ncbi:hypothetical protein N5J23_08925 [Comamonas aquatica]|uniref:Uncharacterized protein n=1 Tax=Comamonas aquatica TaxID=225991 RepID=A0AA42L2H2_9BURK|nr:hypothetical protein [Comamonas aquatica]MDH0362525.1 hypothetical protein [Comamonas aquatica]MDH1605684.1 hypothetical protein [Comamonas aquatica]MDH1617790.1 hypothetical protein [Comamonas aquatica]MDH2005669.1 hypothetical protein [Comamonas aquatica]